MSNDSVKCAMLPLMVGIFHQPSDRNRTHDLRAAANPIICRYPMRTIDISDLI